MSIVTLTMNPAIDIATRIPRLRETDKMRCATPRFDPGGGGINVARTVRALGEPVVAIVPAGGYSGRLLRELVDRTGIEQRTVPMTGPTRENLAVTDESSGGQYRFVFPGVPMSDAEQRRCLAMVSETSRGAEFLIASGSLPPNVPADFYRRLAQAASAWNVPMLVDTSGPALRAVHDAYLIKPSVRELGECVGGELRTRDDQIEAARTLIVAGVARVVVVSLGAGGALAVTENSAEWFTAVAEPVISGIGAGDAMLGGIAVGLVRGAPLGAAMCLGIAAATAALGTPGTAPGRSEHIAELYRDLTTAHAATPG